MGRSGSISKHSVSLQKAAEQGRYRSVLKLSQHGENLPKFGQHCAEEGYLLVLGGWWVNQVGG